MEGILALLLGRTLRDNNVMQHCTKQTHWHKQIRGSISTTAASSNPYGIYYSLWTDERDVASINTLKRKDA
jgi:hypothetical protein